MSLLRICLFIGVLLCGVGLILFVGNAPHIFIVGAIFVVVAVALCITFWTIAGLLEEYIREKYWRNKR